MTDINKPEGVSIATSPHKHELQSPHEPADKSISEAAHVLPLDHDDGADPELNRYQNNYPSSRKQ